jgi:hypothetical protein
MLAVKEDGAYTENDGGLATKWQPNGNQMATKWQPSIVKYSEVQDSVVEDNIVEDASAPPSPSKPARHKYGDYKNVLLSDEEYEKLVEEFPNDYDQRIERLSGYIASTGKTYKNHLATIRNWAKRDVEKKSQNNGSGNPFLELLKEEYDG